ncbi:S41 family peptidase [Pseudoduganella lurida]|nr:S41 family peptidase [Pseudoduganella lurida]
MAATPAAEPVLPATPAAWQAAAMRDIAAGYEVTLAKHAGALDPHNPAFTADLAKARDHGLALAARVTNAQGYAAALQGFTVRIHDGHAGLRERFDLAASVPPRWPGFVAAWRGDLFVYAAEGDAARAGERIVSCDGRTARQLMEDNVFAFQGRSDEAGQWWSEAPYLFSDTHNPFVARPQRCVFEQAGRRVTRELHWRPATAQARTWQEGTMTADTLPVGLTEPRPGLFWMAMPTFKPNDAERAAYHAVRTRIATGRDAFLRAQAVVVDLRRNSGGNSTWSRDFAMALWGEDRVRRRAAAATRDERTWYRASAGNIAHYRQARDMFQAQGETATVRLLEEIGTGMLAAQAAGQPYWIKGDAGDDAPPPPADPASDQPGDPAPFTRPVYVIVPGDCASACLDAVDVFKLFANTKLVGAPSSADSTYMDVRRQELPGGLARVLVPTKLYVNRPRGNGQFYRPDIPVTTVQWNRADFQRVIEDDLKR